MIRRAQATRYDRLAENGRTRPLRVAVETDDGIEYEVFLKVSGAPELSVEGLCCEALSACIAAELGLPVCEPVLVEITPEWIDEVPNQDVQAILRRSAPIAFGSVAAGAGWRPWSPDDRLTVDRRDIARAILAFDLLAENPDRARAENPNLLLRGNDFRIIDHELALRVQLLIPKPQPWTQGGLAHMRGRHIFATQLRGTTAVDLANVHAAWSALSDDQLSEFEAALPIQWAAGNRTVESALTHVRHVRDRIDDCILEIERVLA